MFLFCKDDRPVYIEIFLSTLPYNILIQPFKDNMKLRKKLAGFRLIKESSPPEKIIPILCNEIIKGNFDGNKLIDEWKKIYHGKCEEIHSLDFKNLEERTNELCRIYTKEIFISCLLVHESNINILQILDKALKYEEEDINNSNMQKEIELDKANKTIKRLYKEMEKLKDKLIKEEKKNIIESENFQEKLDKKNKEIDALNMKISELLKEKEILEARFDHIGAEFEKRIIRILDNNSSKEKNFDSIRLAVNKMLTDIRQDSIEFKNSIYEIREILEDLTQKIENIYSNNSSISQVAATRIDQVNNYSLVKDLSDMLKNM